MNQMVHPTAMPMTPPAALPPVAAAPAEPQADAISPAEAKFWQEWAAKAPGLLRTKGMEIAHTTENTVSMVQIGSVALGAALTGVSFSKMVSGGGGGDGHCAEQPLLVQVLVS